MLISRVTWSDLARPGSELTGPLPLVIIHHSFRPDLPASAKEAAEVAALRSMDTFHRETNGWAGLAYSFCVFQSGRIYEARGWLRAGAHTEGHNRDAHAFCFVMDGSKHAPTAAAVQAVKDAIAEGVQMGAIAPGYQVEPHDKYKNKVCPGDKIKAILRQLGPGSNAKPRVLKFGMTGPDVAELQKLLKVAPTNGNFGAVTKAAVINFQKKNGLVADGVVGPLTRAKLGM